MIRISNMAPVFLTNGGQSPSNSENLPANNSENPPANTMLVISGDSWLGTTARVCGIPRLDSRVREVTGFGVTESIFSKPQQDEGVKLRTIACELVSATRETDEQERVNKLKIVFARHPEMLQWILERRNISELLEAADLPGLPPSVKSGLDSLDYLISSANDVFRAKRIYDKFVIDAGALKEMYSAYSEGELTELVAKELPSRVLRHGKDYVVNMLVARAINEGKRNLQALSVDDRRAILDYVPDAPFRYVGIQLHDSINEAKLSETPAVQMLLDPETGFDLNQVPPTFREFFRLILSDYFDSLPFEDKSRMVEAVLALPPDATPIEKLGCLVHNSGPVIQKLFQLFAQDVKSDFLGELMHELKANVRPFPTDEAVKSIEESYGEFIEDMFDDFPTKPAAAASIGQVYVTKLKDSDREIVVKVLRPGLREKAAREIELLRNIAPNVGMQKIVDRLEESLNGELDLALEHANMGYASVYDKEDYAISGCKPVAEFKPCSDILVMDKAPGKPIHKASVKSAAVKNQALKNLMEIWLRESFFGNGFFHGDLHGGNIFFREVDRSDWYAQCAEDPFYAIHPQMIPEPPPPYELTLIDFGNASSLTRQHQRALLGLILGAETGCRDTMVDAVGRFHELDSDAEEMLEDFIQDLMDDGVGGSEIMNRLVNFTIEKEMNIPKELLLFNRARAFLEKQIEQTNQSLAEAGKQGEVEVSSIYKSVIRYGVAKDLIKSLFWVQSEREARVPTSVISDIVSNYLLPAP
ncbi:MAG: AarF/ABC1/UbiB kinase family protein [Myxococcota bacterium]|nr:AarF/ABC1/UbiB kinase family protein [Myxococcota bacterium]